MGFPQEDAVEGVPMSYPPGQPGRPGQHGPWGRSDQSGEQGSPGQHGLQHPHGTPQPFPGQPAPQQFGHPTPGGEPPKRRRTGLNASLAIAGVVLAGGAVALVLWLGSDDERHADGGTQAAPGTSRSRQAPPSPSTPPSSATPSGTADAAAVQDLAERMVGAVNAQDEEAAKDVVCDPSRVSFDRSAGDLHYELAGDPEVNGGKAEIGVTATSKTRDQTQQFTFDAVKRDGDWCISN